MKKIVLLTLISLSIPNSNSTSANNSLMKSQGFIMKCIIQQGYVVANKRDLVFGKKGPIKEIVCIK